MQKTNLAGKLETEDVVIIGNDPHSNAKKQESLFNRICYNCGEKFKSEDKTACRCADCIKLYNQSKQKQIDIPFVDAWKAQKIQTPNKVKQAFLFKNMFLYGIISMGLIGLAFVIILLQTMIMG